VTLGHLTSSTGMLIKTLTHVHTQITLKMVERNVICIGCGVNLKEKSKIRRNLGQMIIKGTMMNHMNTFLLLVITFWIPSKAWTVFLLHCRNLSVWQRRQRHLVADLPPSYSCTFKQIVTCYNITYVYFWYNHMPSTVNCVAQHLLRWNW